MTPTLWIISCLACILGGLGIGFALGRETPSNIIHNLMEELRCKNTMFEQLWKSYNPDPMLSPDASSLWWWWLPKNGPVRPIDVKPLELGRYTSWGGIWVQARLPACVNKPMEGNHEPANDSVDQHSHQNADKTN